jgi:hypothetical protein
MSDLGISYPDEKKISKATKMVILSSIEKRKYLCAYHFDILMDSGVAIASYSTILEECGTILCDECIKE